MARANWEYLQQKTSESGQTSSKTYDLPEGGYLEELLLTIFSTPTASTTPANPISDAVTSIKIKDGGEIIKSLSASQLKGLSMIHKYPKLASTEINDNAAEGYDQIFIPLGHILNGTRYAPRMDQFRNPQIEIAWDYSITTTASGMTVGADTAPAIKISVLANVIPEIEGITHGYVRSQSVKTWTQAASSTERTTIARDYPLVGVGYEGGYDAKLFTDDLNEAELNFNSGDWVPFQLKAEEIASIQQAWFRHAFEYSWLADLESADELDTHMGYLASLLATPGTDTGLGLAAIFDGARKGVETITLLDLATPTATDEYQAIYLTSIGWMPFRIWYCPMRALTGGAEDTVDAGAFSRIEFVTKSGSSASTSSTPEVITEHLVT